MKKKRTLDKKFFSYYRPYMGWLIADLVCAVLMAGISLIYPLIIRYITNDVLVNNPIGAAMGIIWKLAAVMLALVLLEGACNFFVTSQGHIMGVKMEYDMRNEIFGHFQKLSFGFYDDQKTGQLMARITNDLFNITELLHHGPEDIMVSLIKFIGAFVILLGIDVKLTLIVFSFIPVMLVFTVILNKKMKRAFKKNRERLADINAQVEDNLSGIRVVKSFANEDIEIRKFLAGNKEFVASKKRTYGYMASFYSGVNVLTGLMSMLVVVAGTLFMANDGIGLSDLLTYLLYINNFIEPIKKLINFTEQFQDGITGYERFREILDMEPEIQDREDAEDITDVRGDITFDHVSFRYGDGLENVLTDLNLQVPAGDYVALVGPSGVGKSTLCNLIPRFYEATEGTIYLDGKDIRGITQHSLRSHIGMVQQDVYLFAGNVMENIRYGRPDATDEEVYEAAKNANAHEFILGLTNGYETNIGQRGIKLSGGQKQRLSIARVFLKNPPILIFDEATSALDNESEKVVQESLERLAKNRTTFVIAHRLSTIQNAKKILVLTEDGIAESGTHEELLAKGGVYAGLYQVHGR